jgi:hypothetical protein
VRKVSNCERNLQTLISPRATARTAHVAFFLPCTLYTLLCSTVRANYLETRWVPSRMQYDYCPQENTMWIHESQNCQNCVQLCASVGGESNFIKIRLVFIKYSSASRNVTCCFVCIQTSMACRQSTLPTYATRQADSLTDVRTSGQLV